MLKALKKTDPTDDQRICTHNPHLENYTVHHQSGTFREIGTPRAIAWASATCGFFDSVIPLTNGHKNLAGLATLFPHGN